MAAERNNGSREAELGRFVIKDFQKSTDQAVERELKRIRPRFNFTDADLRRLRQPRRRHAS